MHYYGRYYRSKLYPLLHRVSTYLKRWAGQKYTRLRTYKRFKRWRTGLIKPQPNAFAQWQWVRAFWKADEKRPVTGDRHAGSEETRGCYSRGPPDSCVLVKNEEPGSHHPVAESTIQ